MKNRYEKNPAKLKETFEEILKYEEYYLSITPKEEIGKLKGEENNYSVGRLDGLREIVQTNLASYATASQDFLDKLIHKKAKELTDKFYQNNKSSIKSQREIDSYYNGIADTYNNIYRLCYGFEEDVLLPLEEARENLKGKV